MCMGPVSGITRCGGQQDGVLASEGWLKEGLCHEEHPNVADFGLAGRQPSEEICELGFGGKADALARNARTKAHLHSKKKAGLRVTDPG